MFKGHSCPLFPALAKKILLYFKFYHVVLSWVHLTIVKKSFKARFSINALWFIVVIRFVKVIKILCCLFVIALQLEIEHRKLLGEIDGLQEQVKALWERLEIDAEERSSFLKDNSDLSPKTARAVSFFLKFYLGADIYMVLFMKYC